MMFLKYAAICVLTLSAVIILGFCIVSRKPIRYIVLNALLGIVALVAVDLTAKLTGIRIPVNECTVGGAATFGIPAVCGFLIARMIF